MKSIKFDRIDKVRVLFNCFKAGLLADVPKFDAGVFAAGRQVVGVVGVEVEVEDFVPVDWRDFVAGCAVSSVVDEEVVALGQGQKELVVGVDFDDAVGGWWGGGRAGGEQGN